MNIFDAIGKTTFDAMRVAFGYPATWVVPGAEMPPSARVLYKSPTEAVDYTDGHEYTQARHVMEYYETDFPGLIESVEDANNEAVKIEVAKGVLRNFIVKRCERKTDGKTIKAFLTEL